MVTIVVYSKEKEGFGMYYSILPQRLVADKPVCLESHMSSSHSWAVIDLTERTDRKTKLDKLFGEDNWKVEIITGCDIEEMYKKCDEINKGNEQITYKHLEDVCVKGK